MALLALSLAATGGCFSYRAIAQQPTSPTAVGGSRGTSADGSETIWSFVWGAVQENPTIDNCEGLPLAEVTVKTNLAFALLTVATLGFASPARVEWHCAKPDPDPGVIDAGAGTTASAPAGDRKRP